MKRRYEVIHTVECIIDIPDDKIDGILKDYQSCIYTNATVDDLFSQIAYTEVALGGGFAEGVGQEYDEFTYEEVDTDTEYNIMEDIHE